MSDPRSADPISDEEGWDYELFRVNLEAGAFDTGILIERRNMAGVARRLIARLDASEAAAASMEADRDAAVASRDEFVKGYNRMQDRAITAERVVTVLLQNLGRDAYYLPQSTLDLIDAYEKSGVGPSGEAT